jgi:Zn-dependent protease with chaperone function
MYAGLGATLVLAAFAAASAAAALALRVLGPRLRLGTARLPAARRSGTLAALRLLPSALGGLVAGGLVAPAYLAREPRDAGEAPGLVLGLLAALGGALLAISAARILASWRATRRLLVEWRAGSEPLDLGAPAPTFRTRSAFPVVAAVGVLRPHLFVAAQVLEGLADDEREAVLAHEAAHLRARDNLTGLLLRACPDGLLWGREAGVFERAWREAAEQAADERAALGAPGRAASLAAALVKVARMVPQDARLGLPAAALHGGETVADRVARLLRLSREGPRTEARGRRTRSPRYVLLGASLVFGLAAHAPVLDLVHAAIERVVGSLP